MAPKGARYIIIFIIAKSPSRKDCITDKTGFEDLGPIFVMAKPKRMAKTNT